MNFPTLGDWDRLKHLGRYLKGKLRMVDLYRWQARDYRVRVYTDAGWAGDREDTSQHVLGFVKAVVIGRRRLAFICSVVWSKVALGVPKELQHGVATLDQ